MRVFILHCKNRYDGNAYAKASTLPISRTMFHGNTMVQCDNVSEETILKLMLQPAENRKKMQQFLRDTHNACVPATLDCIPINVDSLTASGPMQV